MAAPHDVTGLDFAAGEILRIDKPRDWTSFDVVAKVRNAIRVKKVGHAGTLDPLATGLLILATGKATKTLNEIVGRDKEYVGQLRLGETTPSYDGETEPVAGGDASGMDEAHLRRTMAGFVGALEQLPPAYSAVKVDGRRLYESARKGHEVERPARAVVVYEFELLSFDAPDAEFRVRCGKGTYIRSLVHDLGQALGVGAWMTGLRRTAIGDDRIEDAWNLEEFVAAVRAQREDE